MNVKMSHKYEQLYEVCLFIFIIFINSMIIEMYIIFKSTQLQMDL